MAATILLVAALALSATVAEARLVQCAQHPFNTLQAQALTEFTMAVNRYAEVHRLVENPLSKLASADPEQMARARRAHRAAILEAHGTLQRGQVFTPRVSAYIRCRIQLAERSASLTEAPPWSTVLLALPELPIEIEYRVEGRSLVLLDPEVNLVVDVLDAAFLSEWTETEGPELDEFDTCAPEEPPLIEGSPCDAHSELDMCWC